MRDAVKTPGHGAIEKNRGIGVGVIWVADANSRLPAHGCEFIIVFDDCIS
jgi:hypothetical protein